MVEVASAGPTQMSVRLDEGHGIDDWRDQQPPVEFAAQLQPGPETVGTTSAAGSMFRPASPNPAQSVPPAPTVTVEWRPAQPIFLPAGDEPSAFEVAADFAVLTTLLLGLQWMLARQAEAPWRRKMRALLARWAAVATKRPAVSLALVGICAAVASSYPVVFAHKSFVSPNAFPYLLYTGSPTVPGVPKEPVENAKGSDVAATLVYSLPNSALEYDAIFRDHEFPFWNRYVSTGLPLFGQGQSMLGNPLHFLGIAANGAAWAWDLKFLLAKALFSFGLGLCVWLLTRRLGVSALLGASGAWIGFFAYRMNHPAFFSMSFSPWVLLPWLTIIAANDRRSMLAAVFGLQLADWCELTSGTAKEACMLLIFMNAVGVLVVLLEQNPWSTRIRRLVAMIGASFCFLLLSAPHWLLFLDALRHGVSWYDTPVAYQLPPGLLVGFFDDIFSQDFTPLEVHTHPSANFLVLAGVLWLVVGGVQGTRRRAAGALAWTALPLAALVFGVVPPAWIKAAPFLGNIYHIFNTFGLPLIIILLLLAGIGLSECLDQSAAPQWKSTYGRMVIGLLCVLALYLGHTQATPVPQLPSLNVELPWHSLFFLHYSVVLVAAALAFPWALRWIAQPGADHLAGIILAGVCLFGLHFRHGMYVHTRFDDYVMTPRTAADLAAPSPALERIRHHSDEPYRTAGIDLVMSPDYNALARLESIGNLDSFTNAYYSALVRDAHLPNSATAHIFLPEKALPALKPVLDFLNLRYYLRERKPGQEPLPGLAPLAAEDLEVDESREAWPRAFFSDHVAHYGEVPELVSLLQHGDGRPFAAVQGGEADPKQAAFSARQIVPASQYRHSTNVTEFTVNAPGPGIIVLGEAFEEDNFRVTLNGAPVPYLRVNQAFKGVRVEHAGPCRLRFEYWPHLLGLSLWMSAAGALCTATLAGWITRQRVA